VKRRLKWEDGAGTQVDAEGSGGDGIFWMSFSDFLVQFATIHVCRLFDASWKHLTMHGEWVGKHATGCANYKNLGNAPQYRVEVKRPTHLIVVLTQHPTAGEELFAIGMNLQDVGGKRTTKSYKKNVVLSSPSYQNSRSVIMESHNLSPGTYTLVATTFDPDEECTFTLSLWSDEAKYFAVERIPYDDEEEETVTMKSRAKVGSAAPSSESSSWWGSI